VARLARANPCRAIFVPTTDELTAGDAVIVEGLVEPPTEQV
jgi:hypothetical protein